MIELCRHIKPEGTSCKGAAVHGTNLCRHHQLIKSTLAKVKPTPKNYGIYKPLPFEFPEDRAAIQTNLFLVLHAFNHRKIDSKAANFMTYNLQVCLSNLSKAGPLAPTDSAETVKRVILTPEGDEIAPPREVLEKDESPIHHKNCPCQRCAERFRGAAPEQHHADCKCGLCETIDVREDSGQGSASDQNRARHSTTGCQSAVSPSATDTSASSVPAVVERAASAHDLQSADTLDLIQKEPNFHDYIYGDEIAKRKAQYAARARAALEAGLELPEYQPFDPGTHEDQSGNTASGARGSTAATRK